jgi:hypothetical protein
METTGGEEPTHDDLDHLGQRRLSTAESWWWYGVAFVSYVVLGVWHKWLLNWFVGPAWLVATVWFGPQLVDAIRERLLGLGVDTK